MASVSNTEAARILDQLASVHLLDEHVPNRFRLPPLLNTYAAERLHSEEPESAGAQALSQVVIWYLHMAAAAGVVIDPHRRHLKLPELDRPPTTPPFADHAEAMVWCDAELENLVAAVHAAANGQLDTITWQLPLALGAYLDLRKAWQPWIETHHLGLSAARRQGVRVAEAWLLTNLAEAYCDLRR